MKNPVVEVKRFRFSIDGQEILKDISISVEEGDFISVVGPNGAGKSTFLKCLMRLYRGGEGEIKILGIPLDEHNRRDLARSISYVPQADGRFIPFTVREFVMMGRYPYLGPFSSPGTKDERAVDEALFITGTSRFSDRYMDTLSGGERQKVWIAAALAQEANIMLLDEPTTFLDPKHSSEVLNLLVRLNRERKTTIISVTHDINSATIVSHRVLALKAGSVVFFGEVARFMEERILREVYDVPFSILRTPGSGRVTIVPEIEL